MEKIRPKPATEALLRHISNLLIFTGFWKGKYFINGICHPNLHGEKATPKHEFQLARRK